MSKEIKWLKTLSGHLCVFWALPTQFLLFWWSQPLSLVFYCVWTTLSKTRFGWFVAMEKKVMISVSACGKKLSFRFSKMATSTELYAFIPWLVQGHSNVEKIRLWDWKFHFLNSFIFNQNKTLHHMIMHMMLSTMDILCYCRISGSQIFESARYIHSIYIHTLISVLVSQLLMCVDQVFAIFNKWLIMFQ